jgi:tRNA threonylcarbamoyladenosine biosynthesis protein TsaE
MDVATETAEETEATAARLAALLRAGDLLCLSGDLGAGKTTFTRGLARGLGSPALVSSPTFTLIHEYGGGRLPVYHADAYRLTGGADAVFTGLEEYLDRGDGVLVVEWWERIADILPAERLEIELTETGDEGRQITFTPQGNRWQEFAAEWEDASC